MRVGGQLRGLWQVRGEEMECREFGKPWRKLDAERKREIRKWPEGSVRSRKVFIGFFKIEETEPCTNAD